jgi:hypothetical protein
MGGGWPGPGVLTRCSIATDLAGCAVYVAMQRTVPISTRLRAAVEMAFAEPERDRVVAALQTVLAPELERVRIAVLVLAVNEGATAPVVEAYARAALLDWRDVLYWAEYHPDQIDYEAAVRSLQLPDLTP